MPISQFKQIQNFLSVVEDLQSATFSTEIVTFLLIFLVFFWWFGIFFVILQIEIGVCRKVHAALNRRKAVSYFMAV